MHCFGMSFEGFEGKRSHRAVGQFLRAFEGFCGPSRTEVEVIFIQAGDELGGEEGALIEWQGKGFVKDGVEGDGTHGFSLAESLGGARLERGARASATKRGALL